MKKFEYMVFEANAHDYEKIEKELIKNGYNGWELISVISYVYTQGICMKPERVVHYFKREVVPVNEYNV